MNIFQWNQRKVGAILMSAEGRLQGDSGETTRPTKREVFFCSVFSEVVFR